MALASSFMAYIRFFTLLSPIIIPTMAIFGSLFDANFKGFVYVLGLTIATTFGSFIAPVIGKKTPGGTGSGATFKPGINAACNLLGNSIGGWGVTFSMPGPHALILAFTATYLMFPMFLNSNVNLVLIGSLIFILVMSAAVRISAPLGCVAFGDVVAGWATGFILGGIWYFTVVGLAGTDSGLTYFENEKSDRQQCVIDKKSFRCRRKRVAN